MKTHSLRTVFKVALTLITFSLSAPAWAYYGVLDNGEILSAGHYKLTGDLQALTSSGGLNIGTRFDIGFQDEFGARAILGAGTTDVFFGGLLKWMPVPDIEGQPAIGFNAGLLYANDGGTRDLTFRFEPLVSKKFKVDDSYLTPYASLPIGLRQRDAREGHNTSYVTTQLVAGSQLEIPKWKNLQFIGELGLNLDNAFSYVSVGAILYFDSENGVQLQ